MNISVATYAVTVNKKRKSNEFEILSNIESGDDGMTPLDFYDLVKDLISQLLSSQTDEALKSLLRIKTHEVLEDERIIQGVLETGAYGQAGDIRNAKTDSVPYVKTPDDASMAPFYFSFYIPRGKKNGLLLLQRFGANGIHTLLTRILKSRFAVQAKSHTLKIEEIVHPALVEAFTTKSSATAIKFRMHTIPKDLCDQVLGGNSPTGAYFELSIFAKKRSTLGPVERFIAPKKLTGLLTTDMVPDETRLEVSVNGKRRTLLIENKDKIRSYYDISDKVQLDVDGNPKVDQLKKAFKELISDLWKVAENRHDPVQEDEIAEDFVDVIELPVEAKKKTEHLTL